MAGAWRKREVSEDGSDETEETETHRDQQLQTQLLNQPSLAINPPTPSALDENSRLGAVSLDKGLSVSSPLNKSRHDTAIAASEPPYKLCDTIDEANSSSANEYEWYRYLPGDTISVLSRLEHDRALVRFFSFFSNWQIRVIPHLFLRDMGCATRTTSHADSSADASVKYQWAGASRESKPSHRGKKIKTLHHYSPLTHNSILSVALAYSDSEDLRSRRVREKFAQHAKRFVELECGTPTICTVQGLAILSSFHSGFGEQSERSCRK